MIAMIGARKMTSSRIKIRRNVAAPTMASALLPDWVLSSASAAEPWVADDKARERREGAAPAPAVPLSVGCAAGNRAARRCSAGA